MSAEASLDTIPTYIECGTCGLYHPHDYFGDCRNDEMRFVPDELDEKHPDGWKELLFNVHYHCSDCDVSWQSEWSCACDDECPKCGHDIEAESYDDISTIHRTEEA